MAQDDNGPFFGLIQSWHFAVQLENDTLCSSIPAVFALLFKCISSDIDFLECGNMLCRRLLYHDQMKLFDRNLSAHKSKEHLVDPCIRLLTELVQFDGGVFADTVSRRKSTTFQRLDVMLAARRDHQMAASGEKKRPPLRETAVRYVLANLRLQTPAGKEPLLKDSRIVRTFLQFVAEDPPWLLAEVLQVIRKDILEDKALSRSTKERFFNQMTLTNISTLYKYREKTEPSVRPSIRAEAHALLASICVSPLHGLFQPKSPLSLHKRSTQSLAAVSTTKSLDSAPTSDRNKSRMNVVGFLQNLRPHADILQANLITSILKTVPELTSDYFSSKINFTFDPKPTMTWLGYARFIMALIQTPLEDAILDNLKFEVAESSWLIDTILPQPCNQKTMTKCLNQSSPLITFTTLAILNAAFNKLQSISKVLSAANDVGSAKKLREQIYMDFTVRCPDIRHVIAQFRGCNKDGHILREASLRLLASYYVLLPDVAYGTKLDISNDLSVALTTQHSLFSIRTGSDIQILEINQLIKVASFSPTMEWFHKTGE